MEQINLIFSSQITALRKQLHLTQEQVSERLATSPRCLQKWESGTSLPDFIHTLALIHHLNFDMRSLAEEVFANDTLSTAER